MNEAERKIAGMILDLVSAIRRSKRTEPELARAALDWEIEIGQRLNAPVLLVAEEPPAPQREAHG